MRADALQRDAVPVLDRRRAGVLLHPTSLPSGTLGEDAGRFIRWLVAAGFSAWQMLPIGPAGTQGSPYSSPSAFAGHAGLLPPGAAHAAPDRGALARFCEAEAGWLDDYALFTVIRAAQGARPWWEWPAALRGRDAAALRTVMRQQTAALDRCRADQYRFAQAWQALRVQATDAGILLIGDLPMFVVADSADAWAHPGLFRLDGRGRPEVVAGVPPDAFSATGQCWDNPVYDWEALAASGFEWWVQRLRLALRRFDLVRFDHFRGLSETWEIPVRAGGVTGAATEGAWRAVPGRALLEQLRSACGRLPLIAENLGVITPDVERLRRDFGLPGLHVLQFAFDGSPDNPHLPERNEEQGVACTGTHDNDTTLGWWQGLDEGARAFVRDVLGEPAAPMPDALIAAALGSRSRLAMIPLQDLLRFGGEARMNRPGIAAGQWRWRLGEGALTPDLAAFWRARVEQSGRT